MNKGDSSGQYGTAIEEEQYNFVNSVATRVKNRAYIVGGRLRMGTAKERGLNPMPVRAVEKYEANENKEETKTSIIYENDSTDKFDKIIGVISDIEVKTSIYIDVIV